MSQRQAVLGLTLTYCTPLRIGIAARKKRSTFTSRISLGGRPHRKSWIPDSVNMQVFLLTTKEGNRGLSDLAPPSVSHTMALGATVSANRQRRDTSGLSEMMRTCRLPAVPRMLRLEALSAASPVGGEGKHMGCVCPNTDMWLVGDLVQVATKPAQRPSLSCMISFAFLDLCKFKNSNATRIRRRTFAKDVLEGLVALLGDGQRRQLEYEPQLDAAQERGRHGAACVRLGEKRVDMLSVDMLIHIVVRSELRRSSPGLSRARCQGELMQTAWL